MTEEASTVIDRAMHWWLGKRPLSFSHENHLENPTINCANDREKEMARAVAAYMTDALPSHKETGE